MVAVVPVAYVPEPETVPLVVSPDVTVMVYDDGAV